MFLVMFEDWSTLNVQTSCTQHLLVALQEVKERSAGYSLFAWGGRLILLAYIETSKERFKQMTTVGSTGIDDQSKHMRIKAYAKLWHKCTGHASSVAAEHMLGRWN